MCSQAIPLVGAVVALLLFVMLIFAIAGTAMFVNVYRDGCFSDSTGVPEENKGQMDASGCGGWRECPTNYTCVVRMGFLVVWYPVSDCWSSCAQSAWCSMTGFLNRNCEAGCFAPCADK